MITGKHRNSLLPSKLWMKRSPLTLPVLGLQDWCQVAGGNVSGHLAGRLRLALLAGHVERRVPVAVLQLQAGPFLHQLPHHMCHVQVGSQVQRALRITKTIRPCGETEAFLGE